MCVLSFCTVEIAKAVYFFVHFCYNIFMFNHIETDHDSMNNFSYSV